MNEKLLQKDFETLAKATSKHIPPRGHNKRFEKRLLRNKEQGRRRIMFRIAVVALLLVGLGAISTNWNQDTTTEVYAFQQTESYLTSVIQTHLETIENIEHPSTSKIISDTKNQINRMHTDYVEIHSLWKKRPTQPQLISALIGNLKKQIDLLTDLQEQLIKLKTKKQANEIL